LQNFAVAITDFHDCHRHDQVGVHHMQTHLVEEADQTQVLNLDAILLATAFGLYNFLDRPSTNANLSICFQILQSFLNQLSDWSLLYSLNDLVSEDRVEILY